MRWIIYVAIAVGLHAQSQSVPQDPEKARMEGVVLNAVTNEPLRKSRLSTGPVTPSSRQLGDWLWHQTALGAALQSLRRTHLQSDDDRLKLVATMFLVPGARVPAA